MSRVYPPTHPGEILFEEFMGPLELSEEQLAAALAVDRKVMGELVKGSAPITADLALRLGRYFGTTPELWMNLQAHYDLELAKDEKLPEIERLVQVRAGTKDAPSDPHILDLR